MMLEVQLVLIKRAIHLASGRKEGAGQGEAKQERCLLCFA